MLLQFIGYKFAKTTMLGILGVWCEKFVYGMIY